MGIKKSGTSALFQMLKSSNLYDAPLIKESCGGGYYKDKIIPFSNFKPRIKLFECHEINQLKRLERYQKSTLAIIIIRNHIDWVYSSYRFWCHKNKFDHDCKINDWVTNSNYRNPELFNQLVYSKGTIKNPWEDIINNGQYYINHIEEVIETFDYILLLRADDLWNKPKDIITNLNYNLLNKTADFEIGKYNHFQDKGPGKLYNKTFDFESSKEISDFAYCIISQNWINECKMLEKYIKYTDDCYGLKRGCSNIIEDKEYIQHQHNRFESFLKSQNMQGINIKGLGYLLYS